MGDGQGGERKRERERERERKGLLTVHTQTGDYTHTPGIKAPTFGHNTMLPSTEPNSPILGSNCQQTCDLAEVTLWEHVPRVSVQPQSSLYSRRTCK